MVDDQTPFLFSEKSGFFMDTGRECDPDVAMSRKVGRSCKGADINYDAGNSECKRTT
jgi:hypothetical protein